MRVEEIRQKVFLIGLSFNFSFKLYLYVSSLCLYCTREVSTNFEVKKEIKIKNSIKPSVGSVTSPLLLLYNCPIAYHVVNFVYFLFEYTYVRSKCTFILSPTKFCIQKIIFTYTHTHVMLFGTQIRAVIFVKVWNIIV